MMRSLYFRILLGFGTILVLTLLGLEFGFRKLVTGPGGPDFFVFRTLEFHHRGAKDAFQQGGKERLAEYLRRLDEVYGGHHALIDSGGIDRLDGTDRSARILSGSGAFALPFPPAGEGLGLAFPPHDDGGDRLLFQAPFRAPDAMLPYVSLLLVGVVLACLLVAYQLIRPLSRLKRAVSRFGGGDLSSRSGLKRKDEIGKLATEFDRMADRIEALLTAERRLLQDVSHELRSPLARLAFAAELAENGTDRPMGHARVRKEIRRLTDLVGELIELTRVEGDPSAGPATPLDLCEIVREVAGDGEVEATAKGCRIVSNLSGPIPLTGRSVLLHRAVENVVRNAIRYTPEGSSVEVRSGENGGVAWVTVRDHGPGVPEAYLESIFRPFFRVDDDRSSGGGGVGLGLAISRRAVALHHGTISARNLSKGLEVRIELPREAAA